jgi:hypothetical protein
MSKYLASFERYCKAELVKSLRPNGSQGHSFGQFGHKKSRSKEKILLRDIEMKKSTQCHKKLSWGSFMAP